MLRRFRVLSLALMCSAAWGAPGFAQSDDNSVARLANRVSQLEFELQRMTGLLEEANYANGQLKQKLERFQTDVDFRIQELEKRGPGAGASAVPAAAQPPAVAPTKPPTALTPTQPTAAPAPSVALPGGNTRSQYEFAFDLLTRNDYPKAESAFRAFIQAHPDDALAGNAQYWLGETFYVRNNFQQAAVEFLTGYQKYPTNAKAPDNLLKLSLALANLGRTKDACGALAKFEKEHATSASVTLKRRAAEERQRLACG